MPDLDYFEKVLYGVVELRQALKQVCHGEHKVVVTIEPQDWPHFVANLLNSPALVRYKSVQELYNENAITILDYRFERGPGRPLGDGSSR